MDWQLLSSLSDRTGGNNALHYLPLFSIFSFLTVEELEVLKAVDLYLFGEVLKFLTFITTHSLESRDETIDEETWERINNWLKLHPLIRIPFHVKLFLSIWKAAFPLKQKVDIIENTGTVGFVYVRDLWDSIFGTLSGSAYHLNGLRISHSPATFSTSDFLCLSHSLILNGHPDREVFLLTYMDVTGKYTGKRFSIFDLEDAHTRNRSGGAYDCQFIMSSKLSLSQNSSTTVWSPYLQHTFCMTAPSIFELVQLMRSNRFFHTDLPSMFPITWNRTTGEKSFINPNMLTSKNWLPSRQQWELSDDPNPDLADIDSDVFYMSSHTSFNEKEEKFFKIGLVQSFPLTRNLAPPFWLRNLDAGDSVVCIRNLPGAVPVDVMRKKLLSIFSKAGHIVGYAAYYLPPNSFRDCEFVLIGFTDGVSAKRAESGHCYLYDHQFLIVERADLRFCWTFHSPRNLFLSVYGELPTRY